MRRPYRPPTRVRVSPAHLRQLRADAGGNLVTTEDEIFITFSDGNTIIIDGNHHACRCRIVDHRRYKTIEELRADENLSQLINIPTTELPSNHVYIVLTLELVETKADRVALRASA